MQTQRLDKNILGIVNLVRYLVILLFYRIAVNTYLRNHSTEMLEDRLGGSPYYLDEDTKARATVYVRSFHYFSLLRSTKIHSLYCLLWQGSKILHLRQLSPKVERFFCSNPLLVAIREPGLNILGI